MLKRFGLWPVVVALVLAFALSAWTAAEKAKPPPVVAICDPAPVAPAAAATLAPVAAGALAPDDIFKARLPWKPGADVQKTASGLQYVYIAHGDPKGAHPKATDTVEVFYDGRLAVGGKPFDASKTADPDAFAVNRVIPGWTEGLQLMVPGDQMMFFIPWSLAYGEEGAGGGVIPPKADLAFVVTLKKIVSVQEPYEACWKKALPWKKTNGHKLAKGVQYFSVGDGPKAEPLAGANDIVSVYIDARLDDGSPLGSNFGSGRPLTAPIKEVGPGLDEVLPKMRPGDHWFVQLPNEVAFAGAPPGTPTPKGPVILEVLLDKVMRAPAASLAPPVGAPH